VSAALLAQDPRPVTLIVPDGCWREGRRQDGRTDELQGIERVTIAPGPPSRYRLRSQTDPRRLSTLEAVARALEVLEGERGPEVRSALEATLDLIVDRTLRLRGAVDLLDEARPEYERERDR
jgi:DTW domain-containing protein YfiP